MPGVLETNNCEMGYVGRDGTLFECVDFSPGPFPSSPFYQVGLCLGHCCKHLIVAYFVVSVSFQLCRFDWFRKIIGLKVQTSSSLGIGCKLMGIHHQKGFDNGHRQELLDSFIGPKRPQGPQNIKAVHDVVCLGIEANPEWLSVACRPWPLYCRTHCKMLPNPRLARWKGFMITEYRLWAAWKGFMITYHKGCGCSMDHFISIIRAIN